MNPTSMLWRRLDTPGHDACHLLEDKGGWRLSGTAVFQQEGAPACLTYALAGDRSWRTGRAEVSGWIGAVAVDVTVIRTGSGEWIMNGAMVPGLEGLVDLDLAFTPATNLLQLRRVNLAEGHRAEVPVAWLDVVAGSLSRLPQTYERRTRLTYWYESPTAPYSGLLEVDPSGFIARYPGLWEAEG